MFMAEQVRPGGPRPRISSSLTSTDDHRVEKQVTFVDEIGFERKPRKLGAANADVVLRFPLELSNSLEVEVPLDMRVACRSARDRVTMRDAVRRHDAHRATK